LERDGQSPIVTTGPAGSGAQDAWSSGSRWCRTRRKPITQVTGDLMSKPRSFCGAALLAVVTIGCTKSESQPQTPPPLEPRAAQHALTVEGVGLATPESVLYDEAQDVYLISNINGSPLAVDGNGFISRMAPDGSIVTLKWIDGTRGGVTLNAPKGSALVGETLYVADISAVRLFDRASGEPKASIAIEGATFLNDIAAAPDGSIYVSDTGLEAGDQGFAPSGSDAVYRITPEGTVDVVAKGEDLGHPNGLAFRNGQLLVVTFGTGEIYALVDGKREPIGKPQTGSLDGIVPLADGRVLVSSWEGKCVYALGADRHFTRIVTDVPSPADIGLDSKRAHLLIPVFTGDAVRIVPLS